ncbi:MAG: DUF6265 family protein [Bacteroidota bacterium]
MKAIYIMALLASILIGSWAIQTKGDIKKMEWVLGKWERQTSKGVVYEHWTKLSEFQLDAKNYMVRDGKTTVLETIQLISNTEGVFFIPTVGNQNNAQPVKFTLNKLSDIRFEFVNEQHDFPQYITYHKVGSDSLVAEISGTINGKKQRRQFKMKKSR